jgi:hypothetical protein
MAKEGDGGCRFPERFKLNALVAAGSTNGLGQALLRAKRGSRASADDSNGGNRLRKLRLPCICKSTANFDPVASGLRKPPGGVCDPEPPAS